MTGSVEKACCTAIILFLMTGCGKDDASTAKPPNTGTQSVDDSTDKSNAVATSPAKAPKSPGATTSVKPANANPGNASSEDTSAKKQNAASDTTAQSETAKTDPAQQPAPAVPAKKLTGVEHLESLGGVIDRGVGDRIVGIDLSGTKVADDDLIQLAGLRDLKSLNLSRSQVTNAGIKHLVDLTRLKYLYLFGVPVDDSGVDEITKLERLEVLCLDNSQITDKSLPKLATLKRLEKLHVQSLAPLTDAGFAKLKPLKRLFELKVPSTISDAAIEEFKDGRRCEVVKAEPETLDEGAGK